MKQPDFTQLFFDYFGGKPKKVRYELRYDSSLLHDLAFLSSLIHDARFFPDSLHLRGKHLTIPLERDCWELLPLHVEQSPPAINELYIAKSKFTVTNVEKITWKFDNKMGFYPDTELWIQNIRLGEDFWTDSKQGFQLIIDGFEWICQLTLSENEPVVRIQDQEVPHLPSDKEREKQRRRNSKKWFGVKP